MIYDQENKIVMEWLEDDKESLPLFPNSTTIIILNPQPLYKFCKYWNLFNYWWIC